MKSTFISKLACLLITLFLIMFVIFFALKCQEHAKTKEGFTQFVPPILSQFIPPSVKRGMHPRARKLRVYLEKKYGESNNYMARFFRKSGFY